MRLLQFPVLLITGFTFFACNQQQSLQQSNASTESFFSWQVKGCAEKATRSKTDVTADSFRSFPELKSPGYPAILVEADSLVYTREVSHLCCREVTLNTRRENALIIISEHWFRPGCKCRCSSAVSAVIRRLPAGEYQVLVIETGTDPVNDQPVNGADTLLQQKITVQ